MCFLLRCKTQKQTSYLIDLLEKTISIYVWNIHGIHSFYHLSTRFFSEHLSKLIKTPPRNHQQTRHPWSPSQDFFSPMSPAKFVPYGHFENRELHKSWREKKNNKVGSVICGQFWTWGSFHWNQTWVLFLWLCWSSVYLLFTCSG